MSNKELIDAIADVIDCAIGGADAGWPERVARDVLAATRPIIVASNQEAFDAGYNQAKEDGDLYDIHATYTAPTLSNGDTK